MTSWPETAKFADVGARVARIPTRSSPLADLVSPVSTAPVAADMPQIFSRFPALQPPPSGFSARGSCKRHASAAQPPGLMTHASAFVSPAAIRDALGLAVHTRWGTGSCSLEAASKTGGLSRNAPQPGPAQPGWFVAKGRVPVAANSIETAKPSPSIGQPIQAPASGRSSFPGSPSPTSTSIPTPTAISSQPMSTRISSKTATYQTNEN